MSNFRKALHLYAGDDQIVWSRLANGCEVMRIMSAEDLREVLAVYFSEPNALDCMRELRDALSDRIADILGDTPPLNEFGETADEAQARIDADLRDHCEAE